MLDPGHDCMYSETLSQGVRSSCRVIWEFIVLVCVQVIGAGKLFSGLLETEFRPQWEIVNRNQWRQPPYQFGQHSRLSFGSEDGIKIQVRIWVSRQNVGYTPIRH